jgi:brefeldin A-inhibited guanine nucleotide-exchange protein
MLMLTLLLSFSERDLRSQPMRSKLLSLHLIATILRSHLSIFTDSSVIIHSATTGEQTLFVQAVKQYLCLSLSRNAVSSINQVFELSCEIFWMVLSGMRNRLKKEIEVLLNEIFLPILEMRNSTARQKSTLLNVLIRLCQDPQALVEIYLNYDCDRSSLENIYERLINVISKITQTVITPGSISVEKDTLSSSASSSSRTGPSIPPNLSTAGPSDINGQESNLKDGQPIEYRLKRQSLECLCSVLKSLVIWSSKAANPLEPSHEGISTMTPSASLGDEIRSKDSLSLDRHGAGSGADTPNPASASTPDFASRVNTPDPVQDDPSRFESAKERKTMLLEGIKKFNFKPKRGIDFLVSKGFIPSREPIEVARFLLYADGLNKAQIGEYLGEGDAENIAIMHSFVDLMHFAKMPFTDALRRFLQAFRLPGESQKIDRYMLKFAERYVAGNPAAFANADTAYVFAYSVIMLNTDAHNKQVKHRMTLQDFIKNNSGIDDGKSLPEEYLKSVFDEIQNNEIKMKDEVQVAAPSGGNPSTGLANALATVGRDLQREAYVLQSEGMANKTEALFRTMVRAQRRTHPQQRAAAEQFYSASHFEHVRPMFEVAWMAFLSGISGPLQASEEADVVALCLDAFKDAIRIVCLFGLELERNAFVTTLAKFTFLNNLGEMKSKNIEAIKTLLGIAQTEGNYLKGSWRELLTCVSQLERFQLISGGVDERSLPELGRRAAPNRTTSSNSRATMPKDEVVQAGASSEVTVAADMVFSSTSQLSGTAIVDFVQSLSEVSWEEIQSSGLTAENPRMFSLQKLVEISYYNMNRIRMEWSNIWLILGNHFNVVCTHSNTRVSSFGLDSLRQLSNRFLEKEELSHFKFQKDFLKPFEYTMRNNPSSEAKEMVLQCLQQMIKSRIHNLRSGWRTLFGTLGAASRASERVASYAFELLRQLNSDHFDEILSAGAFADLTVCLTDFAKASHAQRLALQSVSMIRGIVPRMLSTPQCPIDLDSDPGPAAITPLTDDPMVRFWFPILFAFYDIIMNGDDLEVRRVALDSLFEILKRYGTSFRLDFWDTVCQEVLFPIFAVLRSRSDVSRFSTQEDMSVWLSTTMIQALRNLIDLWTFYFKTLERLLPGLLDLLCACICQENDTLARIGTSCLQSLLENNVRKLSEERWTQVVDTFVQLYRTTTASQLFDPVLRSEQVAISPTASRSSVAVAETNGGPAYVSQPLTPAADSPAKAMEGYMAAQQQSAPAVLMTQSERRRIFKQIIVKCVLQLLLIETTNELLSKGLVYDFIPPHELLRLTGVLEDSFKFSRKFNSDKELRTALWKVGFMRQLPNLLKQESSSASTLMNVLTRMHRDTNGKMKALVGEKLIPLSHDILVSYLPLDVDTQARNITAWTPVVVEVMTGLCGLMEAMQDDEDVSIDGMDKDKLVKMFYPLAVDLLGREGLPVDITVVLKDYFGHVGIACGMMTKQSELERKRKVREMRERERVDRRVDQNGANSPIKGKGSNGGGGENGHYRNLKSSNSSLPLDEASAQS